MNKLYSSNYIVNQRSSGYKSTVYAMAEIVDNSVDAESTKIDIVFSEIISVRVLFGGICGKWDASAHTGAFKAICRSAGL